MDLMSEVIRSVRVGSAAGRLNRPSGPTGIRFSAADVSGFHVILRGDCWLITEHGEPVALKPGDVVLALSGASHGLSRIPAPLEDLPAAVLGPGPPVTDEGAGPVGFEFLCAGYRLAPGQTPRYFGALPELITVTPDYDRHPELRALVDLLGADVSGARPGTSATVPALLDLILVEALRQWHEQHDATGLLESDDPAVSTALRELHENPERQWTVARLSEAAGLPRTAFTRRFTAVVGQAPMRYLISWRLGRGAQLLRETDAPLAAIARQVGYSTEFAFAGAFRREYGVSPGRFRHAPRAVTPALVAIEEGSGGRVRS